VFIETRCERHPRASYVVDTLPRARTSQEADGSPHSRISKWKWTLGPRRSSSLRFQAFAVETRSFLPDDQNDLRDHASQGETRQRTLHPFGEQKRSVRPCATKAVSLR